MTLQVSKLNCESDGETCDDADLYHRDQLKPADEWLLSGLVPVATPRPERTGATAKRR